MSGGGDHPRVVVAEAVRTPVGRGHPEAGCHRDRHPNELLGVCLAEAIGRAGLAGADVDIVYAGCVQQIGEQSGNVARNAWLQSGLPVETPAVTVDTQCGSGQQAVAIAAAEIRAGNVDVAIGAGVEHMGHIPLGVEEPLRDLIGTPRSPELMARYDLVGQGVAAEMVAEHWQIGREELDTLAFESHRKAAAASDEGRFANEIVAMEFDGRPLTRDQGIRRDTTLEKLASLRPVFKEDGIVTAGTSSQISDGGAAVLLMSGAAAERHGVRPRAEIVDHVLVGVDPVMMLTGPIPATRRLLERNGLTVADIDRFEVNEAFAPVVGAWMRELEPDPGRVNVSGGAMALGHPLGASGARLLTTIVHELERSDVQLGVVTMCCAGGLGTATLVRRVS